jgi:hypothetical protein
LVNTASRRAGSPVRTVGSGLDETVGEDETADVEGDAGAGVAVGGGSVVIR